jgi:putative transposase
MLYFAQNIDFAYCTDQLGKKFAIGYERFAEWKGIEILEGHVSKDHVHLVLSIPPKYAVSDVVGTIKGRVAIRS